MKLCSSHRSNPILWKRIQQQVLHGSKGGLPNKWSARKAQLAVAIYKNKGGTYIGSKPSCNSLAKWSKEKWNYINPKSHSGRYLPEVVRKHLSKKEKQIENKKKGSKRGKWISYSKSVSHKMHKYGII